MAPKRRSAKFRKQAAAKARSRNIKAKEIRLRKIRAYRIPLDRAGYDKRGKYYGSGEKLWAVDNADKGIILRAPSLKAAKEEFDKRTQ